MANKDLVINSEGSLEQKTLALLLCTAQEKSSQINKALKPLGISFLQTNILHILDTIEGGKLTVNQIKNVMVDDSPNVSRSLNKLMEKGYIIKERTLEDQRIVNIVITDAGRKTHKLADEALAFAFTIDLEGNDLKKLYDILVKI